MRLVPLLLAWLLVGDPVAESVERVRYLRPAGPDFATECEFTLRKSPTGATIESVTTRGKVRLTVAAQYADRDRLTSATATLVRDGAKVAATVTTAAGKATVQRAGQKAQEFDVPAGVIVTSAPDWTDTFLLCRRYDRKQGGKQSFPGLWIHPEQPAHRLTFALERVGEVTIEHGAKKVRLGRYTIWLRGNSSYAAWADADGQMVRLVPLPYKDDAANWLVLDGYERSTAQLRP